MNALRDLYEELSQPVGPWLVMDIVGAAFLAGSIATMLVAMWIQP